MSTASITLKVIEPIVPANYSPDTTTNAYTAMRYFSMLSLLIVGLIHLIPLTGVMSASKLHALYGISVTDPNAEILLRHRAVLFGLLGTVMIAGAFIPALQLAAFAIGFVSVASFLWMAWLVGGYNAMLYKVIVVDLIALALLAAGAVAYAALRNSSDLMPR